MPQIQTDALQAVTDARYAYQAFIRELVTVYGPRTLAAMTLAERTERNRLHGRYLRALRAARLTTS